MARMLQRMERQGLIIRIEDETDSRMRQVLLTAKLSA